MSQMALTFDDLPVHETRPPGRSRLGITQAIIDALRSQGIPHACGFANTSVEVDHPGEQAEALFRAWVGAGFELGNHGARHLNLNRRTADEFLADVDAASSYLHERFPGAPGAHFFRYPYLAEGDTPDKRALVREALAARGLKVARVTLNFGDWLWNCTYTECHAAGALERLPILEETFLDAARRALEAARVTSHALFGRDIPQVLLLHNGVFTARMLDRLLTLYRELGAGFIPLDEALADSAYDWSHLTCHEPRGESGYSWFHQLANARGVAATLPLEPPEAEVRRIRKEVKEGTAPSPG
jgi:peptidoglycan/xylan/chitin deacetylase (PgdA/CDA1 family)